MQPRKATRAAQAALLAGAILFLMAVPLRAQTDKPAPFKDFQSYVAWMQKNHKAPFNRSAIMPQGAAKALFEAQAKIRAASSQNSSQSHAYQNTKVNQDRNLWPKVDIASVVDPSDPTDWLVMTLDYRVNFPRTFFHVSTNRGKNWTDDMLVEGADPNIGAAPLSYEMDPALSFDGDGNSYLSALSGNVIVDFTNNYLNIDSEVDVTQGLGDGTYSSLNPINIDVQPCNGMISGAFVCDSTVSEPRNSTDANPNSPNAGTNYVYYTFFCNLSPGPCTDGTATVPSFASVILESHSATPGGPYSAPALVSGAIGNAQYSDMVIDASGTPHIFFDDFTSTPLINMWESTLVGGVWTVSKNPVATFIYNGLTNPNWAFSDSGAAAPGCGNHGHTAYCAFSANQIAGGKLETTPSVYLANINVNNGNSSIARVNSDAFNHGKHHFFSWATAIPGGAVYVGWYDDRGDPQDTNVEYFVAKSLDGGHTFPIQKAVNDVPFNPCNGFPGCSYFGDYTQLASGPDGTVHAAWADTRDGISMQIWSQTIEF
jgi:hypothetical protein